MRFSVVANDLAVDGEQLEKLTFFLCHMYYGWWATTREPSVVMYASRQAALHAKLDKTKPIGNSYAGLWCI
jgi:hypothetical protein